MYINSEVNQTNMFDTRNRNVDRRTRYSGNLCVSVYNNCNNNTTNKTFLVPIYSLKNVLKVFIRKVVIVLNYFTVIAI